MAARSASKPRGSTLTSGALDLHFVLRPKQRAFVDSTAPYSFYVGGIGAGKTYAGSVRSIIRALTMPGSLGLIGAPTYPMLRDTTARSFFSLLPREAYRSYNRSEQHLTLANGAEILFRSLDEPDRVRGLNLAWYWLDEAPLCGYYAWQVLKGRLRQQGQTPIAWATGTPHGRDGFWRDFEGHLQPHHQLFRASTLENAVNLPEGYVDSLGYEGAFYDQEVLGLFTAFEGLVYRFESEPTAPDTHVQAPPVGKSFARVIGGIDWGFTNPSVLLPFGLDGDGRAWQLDEFYERRVPLHETVLPTLVAMTRKYSVQTWYAGPDEPEHIEEANRALADAKLSARVRAADNSIKAGIQTVSRLLAPRADGTRGLYVAPACVHTIAEYGSYQYATTEGQERNPDEKPLKQNDHAMDATRYALHTELARTRDLAAEMRQRVAMRQQLMAERGVQVERTNTASPAHPETAAGQPAQQPQQPQPQQQQPPAASDFQWPF
ncbi:MAG: hypothetical protein IVW57_00275 [Ktedonobacterales bacterium]|nr:hypothetical protein [Ktedonobacterales bacterium]